VTSGVQAPSSPVLQHRSWGLKELKIISRMRSATNLRGIVGDSRGRLDSGDGGGGGGGGNGGNWGGGNGSFIGGGGHIGGRLLRLGRGLRPTSRLLRARRTNDFDATEAAELESAREFEGTLGHPRLQRRNAARAVVPAAKTERARSAIVVLDSLARTSAAATSPLLVSGGGADGDDSARRAAAAFEEAAASYAGLVAGKVGGGLVAFGGGVLLGMTGEGGAPASQWRVEPMPEPRDVLWRSLEELPTAAARARRSAALSAAKAAAFIFWSLMVGGMAGGVQLALAEVAKVDSDAVRVMATAVSGVVPVALNNMLLVLMAPLLGALNELFAGEWSRSVLAELLCFDYLWFLRTVGFFAPLLANSIGRSLIELGRNPDEILSPLANNVPASASFFLSYILLRAAASAAEATGVLRATLTRAQVALAGSKIEERRRPVVVALAGSKIERERASEAPISRAPLKLAWTGFAHLVTVTYAPIAPLMTLVSLVFFAVNIFEATLAVVAVERPEFDSGGRLARLGAVQAADNVAIAAVVHVVVLVLSGWKSNISGLATAVAVVPLALIVLHYRTRISKRQAAGLFGAARGLLPLADAAAVDLSRPRGPLLKQLRALGRERRAWAPPCAPELPPISQLPPLHGPGTPRAPLLKAGSKNGFKNSGMGVFHGQPAGPPFDDRGALHANSNRCP